MEAPALEYATGLSKTSPQAEYGWRCTSAVEILTHGFHAKLDTLAESPVIAGSTDFAVGWRYLPLDFEPGIILLDAKL